MACRLSYMRDDKLRLTGNRIRLTLYHTSKDHLIAGEINKLKAVDFVICFSSWSHFSLQRKECNFLPNRKLSLSNDWQTSNAYMLNMLNLLSMGTLFYDQGTFKLFLVIVGNLVLLNHRRSGQSIVTLKFLGRSRRKGSNIQNFFKTCRAARQRRTFAKNYFVFEIMCIDWRQSVFRSLYDSLNLVFIRLFWIPVIAELRRPQGPPSGAPYSYGKQKETHELIFSWLSWLAVLLVGAYARRRWSRARWLSYSK